MLGHNLLKNIGNEPVEFPCTKETAADLNKTNMSKNRNEAQVTVMKEIERSHNGTILALFFIGLLLSIIPSSLSAYTVGVREGDWIKYGQITAIWSGIGTKPPQIVEWEQTDWKKIDIQNVVNTNVTLTLTTHYKNGSPDRIERLSGNVTTGLGNLSLFIIPASLVKGYTIPTPTAQTEGPMIINDTVTRAYANVTRTINIFNRTVTAGSLTVSQVTHYWDQTTGVLLELTANSSGIASSSHIGYKVTETNIFSRPTGLEAVLELILNNILYIISTVIAIIVIIVAIVFIRRRKQQPTASPSSASTTVSAEEKPS